mgnify:FL=1
MSAKYREMRKKRGDKDVYLGLEAKQFHDLFEKSPPLQNKLGSVWKTFVQLIYPFKGIFALDMALVLTATIINAFLPFIVAKLIDALQFELSQGDFSFTGGSMDYMLWYVVMVSTAVILYRLNALVIAYYEPAFTALSRARLTDHTLARSVAFLSDRFAGRLVHAINEISRAGFAIINHLRWSFIEPVVTSLVLIGTAMTVHPYFSILLVVWLVFYIGGIVALTFGLRKEIKHVSSKKGEGSAAITDSVTNYLTVKLFASRKKEIKDLNALLSQESDAGKKFLMKVFFVKAYQGTLELLLFGGSAWIIWTFWQTQEISIGQIILIFRSAAMLEDYLWSFSSEVINFTQDVGVMAESLEQIQEAEEEGQASAKAPDGQFVPERGEIVFNNLSFSYNKEKELFKGLQLKIGAGERIGLVGHSGSGKTTLVKLLLRFYDVNDNEIVIDRQNITKLDRGSIRKNIAVIPQDANLFNRSVLENIRYGRLDATDEEVFEAAKKANAHEFIMDLAHGYETRLGDRGTKLSGGQRQRIAIARAILKDAPILVLDEATSALDSKSEKRIQEALYKVMEGKTVIAIAHRLSTIVKMNRIIVLDEGEVVEAGAHEELLAKEGRYAELWRMQAEQTHEDES